jgi:hypothetical protein
VLPIALDITNLIQKLQALERNNNTSIDALKATMQEQGWIFEHKVCKETGRLIHFFIASKVYLEYARKHLDILIIDLIYKTNQFKMLLFNIISKLLSLLQACFNLYNRCKQ